MELDELPQLSSIIIKNVTIMEDNRLFVGRVREPCTPSPINCCIWDTEYIIQAFPNTHKLQLVGSKFKLYHSRMSNFPALRIAILDKLVFRVRYICQRRRGEIGLESFLWCA
jgi:hypothetical protein